MKGPKTYGPPGPLAADDPRHGTDRGYWKGCRKDCCLRGHMRRRNLERLHGPRPLIDATGTRRRVQALARLGWSTAHLSRLLGGHRSYVLKIVHHDLVQQRSAEVIAALYDELSMTWCDSPTAPRTAADARARGWAAPLAWDDDTIDDPTALPRGATGDPDPTGVDEVTVERVLAGDWRLPTTRAEKVLVIATWLREQRGALQVLERLTGWNTNRYVPDARRHLEHRQDDVA